MAILVTGSGTLVGENISIYLSKKFKVISTYRSSYPYKLSKIKNIKIEKLDLEKKIDLKKKFNTLIHCASAIPDYKLSKKKFLEINIGGFRKILNLCKRKNVKKIILLSTVSVYGKIKVRKISEKTPTKVFDDPYGYSKFIMERELMNFAKKENVKFIVLRLPAVLGKNSDHNFLSKLVKDIKSKNRNEFILKNPNFSLNNFIHVKTLSKVVYFCIRKNINGIFIMGGKNPVMLKNIIKKILFYKKIKILFKNDGTAFNIDINKALKFKIPLKKTSEEISLFLKENFNIK